MVVLHAFLLALGIAIGCTSTLAPASIPVTVVPHSYSDRHSMEHDTLLLVDVAVGTPGEKTVSLKMQHNNVFQNNV